MISDKDIEYHTPPGADHNYAETNWFSFAIPEQRLQVFIYTVARPGVGVISANVCVYGALVDTRVESLYLDAQASLPAPRRLSDFTLPNGLRIRAASPTCYAIDYVGYDDTEIHIAFEGLMEPFDIHDPAHSPLAKSTVEAQHSGSGLGSGYGGHFDLTGRVTGTLRLFGVDHTVNSIETMDHSWGHRPEIEFPTMGWSHVHFEPDYAVHWINHWDLDEPLERAQTLAHGYVMEDGKSYGLTDMTLLTHRVNSVITAMELEATDLRGTVHRMHGSALMGGPWVCYLSTHLQGSTMRWQLDNGRVGFGLATDVTSLQALTRRHGRRWNRPPAHLPG